MRVPDHFGSVMEILCGHFLENKFKIALEVNIVKLSGGVLKEVEELADRYGLLKATLKQRPHVILFTKDNSTIHKMDTDLDGDVLEKGSDDQCHGVNGSGDRSTVITQHDLSVNPSLRYELSICYD